MIALLPYLLYHTHTPHPSTPSWYGKTWKTHQRKITKDNIRVYLQCVTRICYSWRNEKLQVLTSVGPHRGIYMIRTALRFSGSGSLPPHFGGSGSKRENSRRKITFHITNHPVKVKYLYSNAWVKLRTAPAQLKWRCPLSSAPDCWGSSGPGFESWISLTGPVVML